MSAPVATTEEQRSHESRAVAHTPGIDSPAVDAGAAAGVPLFLQAKLIVDARGHVYEREADDVAAVATSRDGRARRTISSPVAVSRVTTPAATARVQRQCAACAAGAPCSHCSGKHDDDEETVLSSNVRKQIEPVLGADLSDVRVHAGPVASRSARALDARAFTRGQHIWLGEHERASDVALMAHEATHVVQQTGARPLSISDVEDNIMGRLRSQASSKRSEGKSDKTAGPASTPLRARTRGAPAGVPRYLDARSLDASSPIDARTRSDMEAHVGIDLRDVRIHTGPESTAAAHVLGANAFAVGTDVVFADGRYAPETDAGRRLLLHEVTHVAQQRAGSAAHTGEMSKPGDASEREADRVSRGSRGAREAVRERTPVRIARDGPTATAPTSQDLEKAYHIKVIKGNKDWSTGDIADLSAALGKLTTKERGIVSGYELQRWTTPADRAKIDTAYTPKPGVDECGFHEIALGGTTLKISMYDGCFDPATTMNGQPIAQFNILHEVGHAAESSLARGARAKLDDLQAKYDAAFTATEDANNAYNTANDERNTLVDQYTAADAAGKKAIEADVKAAVAKADALSKAADAAQKKLDPLEKSRQAAADAFDRALKAPGEGFARLVEGKDPLTPYSATGDDEAFAEAFALYKIDPDGLKASNKKLYDWFKSGGELSGAPVPAAAKK